MALTFVHALMLFRQGSRNGDTKAIFAANSKLALLFFGRNHPMYREIIQHDIKVWSLAPQAMKELISNSLTVSRTAREGHYQGGDAVLEEINKEAKKWVIGVPSSRQWVRSFRNLDNLNQVKTISFLNSFVCAFCVINKLNFTK